MRMRLTRDLHDLDGVQVRFAQTERCRVLELRAIMSMVNVSSRWAMRRAQ